MVSLLAVFCFAAASWVWLGRALQDSLPTRTLLTDLDVNVFIDLYLHQRSGLQMFLGQGSLLLGIGIVATIWVQAVGAMAMSNPGLSIRSCMSFGRSHLGRFIVLWCVSAALIGMSGIGLAILVRVAGRWSYIEFSQNAQVLMTGAAAGLTFAAYLVISTWHEHARLHCAAGDARLVGAMAWAVRFVRHRWAAALGLSVACVVANVLVYGLYRLVNNAIPVTVTVGVTASLLAAQLWLLVRLFLRLWLQGAAAALQAHEELGTVAPEDETPNSAE